jgi:pimeloyl-ACP methyl ester carboxylesterase
VAETTARPFRIDVPPQRVRAVLDRVAAYPWAEVALDPSWDAGTSPAFLHRACARWTGGYDWYAAQARINALGSQVVDVGGQTIHFLHVTGGDLPVLLVPGWPSTVLDYAEVIRPLADAGHDVVVATLPGFGWSSPPPGPQGPRSLAAPLHAMMTEVLGFDRYVAGGGDFGSYVAPWLALDHPDEVVGVWVTALNLRPHGAPAGATSWPDTFSAEEREFLRAEAAAQFPLLPYAFVQAFQSRTLALAMVDNPVGQAAWILEKYRAWTPLPDGQDPDAVIGLDRLLDQVMVHLLSGSFGASLLIYPGLFTDPGQLKPGRRVEAPTALSAFADPLVPTPPRSFAERAYRIVRWSTPPDGGHFAALAAPETVVAEIVAFTDGIRNGAYGP